MEYTSMLGRFTKGNGAVPPQAEPSLSHAPTLPTASAVPAPPTPEAVQQDGLLSIKVELHRHLIDRFNLAALESSTKEEILTDIRPVVREFVRVRNLPLNARELDQL